MSASLVGSEMCIRDSLFPARQPHPPVHPLENTTVGRIRKWNLADFAFVHVAVHGHALSGRVGAQDALASVPNPLVGRAHEQDRGS
eukprot:2686184-Alexandrium_andersonii.AAC.1